MSANTGIAQRFESERIRFPGLLPEETLVARAWLAIHEAEYEAFDYNVRIGVGDDPGPNFSAAARAAAVANSKLRIDAVCWKGIGVFKSPDATFNPVDVYATSTGAQATLVEFKRRAATGAVTQLSTYFHLWMAEFPRNPQPRLIIACASYSQTIIAATNRAGIFVDPVSVDFSSLSPTFRKG